MEELAHIDLPDQLRIHSVERNPIGETNDVFCCKGEFGGIAVSAYVKVNKNPQLSLSNEQAVLTALVASEIPVPEVLWYGGEDNEVLVLKAMVGDMIWNYIDPRRELYDRARVIPYLTAYGDCLARIHSLDLTWPPQRRPRLWGLIGEENIQDDRFKRLVSWFRAHNTDCTEHVFVHGDLNTASVLVQDGSVSGVLDWEFTGSGWREYDLAWVLRARTAFLNTQEERDAILRGYRRQSSYDESALQLCEVLNYLHFAYWSKDNEPEYTTFALQQAMHIAELN